MTNNQWAKRLHKFRNEYVCSELHPSEVHEICSSEFKAKVKTKVWGMSENEQFLNFWFYFTPWHFKYIFPFARIDVTNTFTALVPLKARNLYKSKINPMSKFHIDNLKYFCKAGKGQLSSEYAVLINMFSRADYFIEDDELDSIAKVLWDTLTILHVLRNYRKTDEEVRKECDLCIKYLYDFDDFKGFLGVVETSSALLPYKEDILRCITSKDNLESFIERYEQLRNLKKEIENTSEALLIELYRDLVTERKAFTAKEFSRDLRSKFRKPFYRDTMREWRKESGYSDCFLYGASHHEFLDAVKERFKQKYKDSADKEFRKFRFTDRYENKDIAKALKNMPRI
ncbi:MAG: hypothetical protein EOM67_01605 [Spirochaetia bacterium]|nr:hypothetical protein [Spirochaetia bacterium]